MEKNSILDFSILDFSNEVLLQIFSNISLESWSKTKRTCKKFKEIGDVIFDPTIEKGFFMEACFSGMTESVRFLLKDERIDPFYEKNSSLNFAIRRGHDEIVNLIINHPKFSFEKHHISSQSLWIAAAKGFPKVLEIFLKKDKEFDFPVYAKVEYCVQDNFDESGLIIEVMIQKDYKELLLLSLPHIKKFIEKGFVENKKQKIIEESDGDQSSESEEEEEQKEGKYKYGDEDEDYKVSSSENESESENEMEKEKKEIEMSSPDEDNYDDEEDLNYHKQNFCRILLIASAMKKNEKFFLEILKFDQIDFDGIPLKLIEFGLHKLLKPVIEHKNFNINEHCNPIKLMLKAITMISKESVKAILDIEVFDALELGTIAINKMGEIASKNHELINDYYGELREEVLNHPRYIESVINRRYQTRNNGIPKLAKKRKFK